MTTIGERPALQAIHRIWTLRDTSRATAKAEKELSNDVKAFMDEERQHLDVDDRGNPILFDGEHNLMAILKERQSETLDLPRLARESPDHLVRLAGLGLLSTSMSKVRGLDDSVTDLAALGQFIVPGKGSLVLEIKEVK